MTCPKCNSKTRVAKTRHNTTENETYRKRICLNLACKHQFFSVEIDVEDNETFKNQWKEARKM
jgi:transcriptional regulator NrdR family protein